MAETAAVRPSAAPVALAAVPKPRRLFSWRTICRQPRFLIGGTFILFLIFLAIAAPLLVRTDPKVSHPADAIQKPSIHQVMDARLLDRVRRVGDLRVGAHEERRGDRQEDQEKDEGAADQEARLAADSAPTEEPARLRDGRERNRRSRGTNGSSLSHI